MDQGPGRIKRGADGWRSVSAGEIKPKTVPCGIYYITRGRLYQEEVPMTVFEKIEKQQAEESGRTDAWMVGEQLKDICRAEPRSAELIDKDLDAKEMSIREAAKKIKAYADSHKTGNFACVTSMESDRILREFYGLGKDASFDLRAPSPRGEGKKAEIVDLADFL